MYIAYHSRYTDNVRLVQETLVLRARVANICGYNTFAEFALEHQMAKNPANVQHFLDNLETKIGLLASENRKKLVQLKKKDMKNLGKEYVDFYTWDEAYYSHMLTKEMFDLNTEHVKEYFPLKHVIQTAISIFENLLGLQTKRAGSPNVWHPDVELYEVWDPIENLLVGHLYLDLYSRKNKCTGGTTFYLRPGFVQIDKLRECPVSAIVVDFPKPSNTSQALLSLTQVKTIFHELGHAFHNICTKTKWGGLCSSNVEHDFVEMPSQLMENWCLQPSQSTTLQTEI
ncbi:metalloendopeptidase [Coemansia spiralis]|uniref:Metalloendopeptidase n=1 Tax=Coemansia spiralis TaxID=417178 RepID=A0A9W8G361_9FUNG|nr:metalloendopeptidase [Coemansia spiralis]